jgi:hypothetical protein
MSHLVLYCLKTFGYYKGAHIGNQTFLYITWETLNHYLGIYEEIEYILF